MTRPSYTTEQEAFIIANYAAMGAKLCGEAAGVKPNVTRNVALKHGLTISDERRKAIRAETAAAGRSAILARTAGEHERLRALAAQACGITSAGATFPGMHPKSVLCMLRRMAEAGELHHRFWFIRGTDKRESRFFADAAHADEYSPHTTRQAADEQRQRDKAAEKLARPPRRTVRSAATIRRSVGPVDTSRARVVVANPMPDRFAVSGPVVGGFATLGVGRYLDVGSA